MSRFAKFSLGLLLVSTGSAFAAADGFYVGAQLGADNASYRTGDFNYMESSNIYSSGLAGGAYFGYQFSPMLAGQVGYVRGQRVSVKNITMASNVPGGDTTPDNGGISLNIWDAALKVMLPIKLGFGAQAKLGTAYVQANNSGGVNNHQIGGIYVGNSKWLPEAGAGGYYDMNKNVSFGADYTHIFKGGNIPNIDMLLGNVTYHFG